MVLMQKDGSKAADVTIHEWNELDNSWTPDWSRDFFEAGGLEEGYLEGVGSVYFVDDVDYCVEQAEDWENGSGDFYEGDANLADRYADVTWIRIDGTEVVRLHREGDEADD